MTRNTAIQVPFGALLFSLVFNSAALAGAAEPPTRTEPKENELLRRAYAEMLCGKFEQALKFQIEAVKADRNNLTARRYLGYSLLKLGSPDKAMEQLAIALQRSTPTAVDMCIFGEACLQCGKLALAQSWFEQALVCDSTLEAARSGLQNVTAARNRYEEQKKEEERKKVLELKEQAAASAAKKELGTDPVDKPAAVAMKTHETPAQSKNNNQTCNAWESFKGTRKK